MIQRPITNTPLQALVVLNDPQFVEAARAFAQKMITEGGNNDKARTIMVLMLLYQERLLKRRFQLSAQVLKSQMESFNADNEKAKKFLSVGEISRDEKIDLVEHTMVRHCSDATQYGRNIDPRLN